MLFSALARSRQGQTVIALLHGKSGIGKSALATHFLTDLARRPQAVVLTGRCYEQELVPYKVLDSLVDSLSRYLSQQPMATAAELIPRDINALVQVFPVLARAAVVTHAQGRRLEGIDQRELRRRAFGALRELLVRLGDRAELVLFTDDLQWGDAESAMLIKDVLRPPDGPRLLFICAYRSEHIERSACLAALQRAHDSEAQIEMREIRLEPLNNNESRILAARLLGDTKATARLAAIVASESAGNPYFLQELARRAMAPAPQDEPTDDLTLDSAICVACVKGLSDDARRLEVVCVAGQPLHLADATGGGASFVQSEGAGVSAKSPSDFAARGRWTGTKWKRIMTGFARPSFRISGRDQSGYHGRPASHSRLRSRRRRGHRDPLRCGGRAKKAPGNISYKAGEKAAEALAFDHAAGLFQRAPELSSVTGEEPGELRAKLAEALANAGRSAEAAVLFQQAAGMCPRRIGWNSRDAPPITSPRAATSLRVERRSPASSIRWDCGSSTLRRSHPHHFVVPPALMARGLELYAPFGIRSIKIDLQRADIAWSAATGLTMADTYSAAASPAAGCSWPSRQEPYRIARSLMLEALHPGWRRASAAPPST
jgi:hypothetical protein